MKTIPLTQNKFATVDDADFEKVNQFNWYAVQERRGCWYARRNVVDGTKRSGQRIEYLHRFILRASPEKEVDHHDGDGLNNVRKNLRECTKTQNLQAFQIKRPGTSKFRGVSFRSANNRWVAQIQAMKKKIHLGYFGSQERAAKAYDEAAKQLFGEFAQLNFK